MDVGERRPKGIPSRRRSSGRGCEACACLLVLVAPHLQRGERHARRELGFDDDSGPFERDRLVEVHERLSLEASPLQVGDGCQCRSA
jgi:hypothetical protein